MTHNTDLSAPPDYSGDRAHRFRTWFGWQPSAARRCPRVAAGLRCLAGTRSCVCTAHRDLLEHPGLWRDARGLTIYTAEPVEPVDGQELASFVSDATALGLYVSVNARSAWSPGRTVLIEVADAAHKPFRKRRA